MKKCKHNWNREHIVYAGYSKGKYVIRRWCSMCGLIQHSHTTGRWYKSEVGPTKLWGSYPEDYPEEHKDPDYRE